jgi:hypothetical protein
VWTWRWTNSDLAMGGAVLFPPVEIKSKSS